MSNGTFVHRFIVPILFLALLALPSGSPRAGWKEDVRKLAGSGGVVMTDRSGTVLFGLHPDTPFMPASTLKIVTAAAAMKVLGPDYRFRTDFFVTREKDLVIVGRGDPLLTSEEVAFISARLKEKGLETVRNIVTDDTFFRRGLVLDGTERSLEPYDAFNGALNVNFNTIFITVDQSGRIASAEPQTPLTPLAESLAAAAGLKGKDRLNISSSPENCSRYAGELFRAFLAKEGVRVTGKVLSSKDGRPKGEPFYRHHSRLTLARVTARMMEFSNNFIANQIFLTMGAERFGPPADAEKSRRVVNGYLRSIGADDVHVEEGSGLSRLTRISPRLMSRVLRDFMPYRQLLKREGDVS